ncbi:hypothetical protein FRC08_013725 [Ceratobasidium sp. 394]|nr:hypothetical protein FRC08_013725 [Ceratobasidium sp. 394]
MGFYDHNPGAYARDYSNGYRIGTGVAGFTGLGSAVSIAVLLSYIARYTFSSRNVSPMARGIRAFSHSALGVYLYSLLISDMVQGLGFAVSLKWASEGGIHRSTACIAQGVLLQVGNLGGALWSIALAYHTFSLLFLVKRPSIWATRIVLAAGWAIIIVIPIVGPYTIQNVDKSGHFYGVLGPWCWIGPGYQREWYLFLYAWVCLALVNSFAMYGLVYLHLSGHLSLKNGKLDWKIPSVNGGLNCLSSNAAHDTTSGSHPSGPGSSAGGYTPHATDPNRVSKHLRRIARRLMLYPLAYSTVTIPIVILRIGSTSGWKAPVPYPIFCGAIYACEGMANVLLFIATRRSLIQQAEAEAVRPRVHISISQAVVREDAWGAQPIHLHELSKANRPEELDGISDKVDLERDGSVKRESRTPDAERKWEP